MTKQVSKSIIVKSDVSSVYQLWRNFQNFPAFMNGIQSVTPTGPNKSLWVMAGPAGLQVDWHAEQTLDVPNSRIAWNCKDNDGLVTTSGQVTFNALSDMETEITVTMKYTAPGGKLGEAIADWLVDPEARLTADLRQFKLVAERAFAGSPAA